MAIGSKISSSSKDGKGLGFADPDPKHDIFNPLRTRGGFISETQTCFVVIFQNPNPP